MSKVLILRNVIVTKEEAVLLRVACALAESQLTLSAESRDVLRSLTKKADATLAKFPADYTSPEKGK